MNPVVGLDVSKGESQLQAFLDKGKPYRKSFSIKHDLNGLGNLLEFLEEVEDAANGNPPSVVLESTGHYHTPVIQFLEEQQYVYIIVNPLISHRAKSSSLRKVKTDAVDAYHLCELFYKEELEPYKKRGIQLLNLRNLTRQQESIAEISAKTKLQLHSLMDQVFPEYRGVFGSLYSKVSLLTLLEFPTSEAVLKMSERELADRIGALCKSRSDLWAIEKAQKLRDAALRNPFKKNLYESHIFNLEVLVTIVLQYQEHLSKIATEIDALANEIEEYHILQSIPGIGEKIAGTIISEVGEIDRFNDAKKLVAFAGVDPSVYSSGKFTASVNRITKRGSNRLRHALYMAVQSGIRDSRKKKTTDDIMARNKRLREFYDKKREEGKPFRVAVIACVNKLLHWIYALLKSRTTFQDIA
ncbi:IS110 family transposase [Gracilibacillus salitolerans]|uniref:IS110 family transposase n=1 Tax=Gracilibacillus salitolerans TaxID=2663022 RepID=A0A5Q2TJI2_9BACI|nr:IS110 family transposase [Gracilibacillus salitolerans]QGH33518.1 IS110 family transposase [Gracilibacillus salitolerans]QGH34159.1 IS110 family transposase [Gracilibacillus salitolerans]QGH35289.1 IS110 family transposase [Gracilibacillus salitolerans]QGH35292.1 IS110 family transposase [Gracilibacillus salitolerans]QGH35931.1 IS110 family transposase [Gracilibacillus salitolerans]